MVFFAIPKISSKPARQLSQVGSKGSYDADDILPRRAAVPRPEEMRNEPHEAEQKKDQARPRQASRTSPPPDAYQGRLAPAIKKTVGLSRDDRWLAHLFPGFLPARAPPAVARPHVG